MENNYIARDLTDEDNKLISEYHEKGKLHPDFLPFPTFNMVQMGYPYPNHGAMVAQMHGGTDENDVLQPGSGMWMKVSDFLEFLELINAKKILQEINTRHKNNKSIQTLAEELKDRL